MTKSVIAMMIGTLRCPRRSRSMIWLLTTPGRKTQRDRDAVGHVAAVVEVVVLLRIAP